MAASETGSVAIGRSAMFWSAGVWACAMTYACVRYVVLGPVPASEIPLFVLNKSLSFAALVLLSATFVLQRGRLRELARGFGVVGTHLAFAHVLAAIALFAIGHFEALYAEPGQLGVRAQLAVVAGIAGAVGLHWQLLRPSHRLVRNVRHAIVGFGVLHVTAIGAPGWLTPQTWHGGLPPITLLSALAGLVGLAFVVARRGRGTPSQ